MNRSAEVAVLGAGPAGLAAAWDLARAGHEVVVLEAAPAVGGMAAGFEVAGVPVDLGSHRLHPSTPPWILERLRGLLGDELAVRPRHGRIRLADRWIAFPLRPADVIRRMPPRFAAGALFDAAAAPLRRPRDDTFAEVVRTGLGPTVLDGFYGPYARKLWGVAPEELDGEVARRRISARSSSAVLRRLRSPAGGAGRTFLYPRRGFGRIPAALADAAADAGAEVRTSSPVRALRRVAGGWEMEVGPGGAGAPGGVPGPTRSLQAEVVVSTLAPAALVGAVEGDDVPPAAVAEAAGSLSHRAVVLLYLVLERPRWTAFDAHYLPGPDCLAARVSEPRNYRDGTGPGGSDPPDRTVLCAEVPCSVGDAVWIASDAALADRLCDELAAMGLPADPVAVISRRLPRVYPVLRSGDRRRLDRVERWLDSRAGLVVCGRAGRFVADNTHHVLEEGFEVARCIGAGGAVDRVGLAELRARTRGWVVED